MQQEHPPADGSLPRPIHLRRSPGCAGEEPGQTRVRLSQPYGLRPTRLLLTADKLFSFMFDHIMPLTEAKEGYDLFHNMKVQKVVFKP